jgi:hypothetical protein
MSAGRNTLGIKRGRSIMSNRLSPEIQAKYVHNNEAGDIDDADIDGLLDAQDALTRQYLLDQVKTSDKLREEIKKIVISKENWLHQIPIDNPNIPPIERFDTNYEFTTNQLLDLFKLAIQEAKREAVGELQERAAELEKKLDDREADLINAKREERERIAKLLADDTFWCDAACIASGHDCYICWTDRLKPQVLTGEDGE